MSPEFRRARIRMVTKSAGTTGTFNFAGLLVDTMDRDELRAVVRYFCDKQEREAEECRRRAEVQFESIT